MSDKNKSWPAWYYGPEGAADIFDRIDDVPAGWQDHPSKVGGSVEPGLPAGGSTDDGANEIDANGNPWDPAINTPNRAKTASGLWQLLPGKSRPAPVKLDL